MPLTVKEILRRGMDSAHLIVTRYLSDMPDDSWYRVVHPQCQTLNWQFGHLVLSESTMIGGSLNATSVLNDRFKQTYQKPADPTVSDQQFSPAELWDYYKEQRAQSLELLEGLSEVQLESHAAEAIRAYCPTVADAYIACSSHWLMHSGQWVVLRRMAGLPIVI